ncbi:hypothetical protein MJO28_006673 [Puccinia striiformis f. sp. tritici]|uniref:Uncharacterized protein n=1 Tax=Puccinia striiformis f. sp. tritici TaxID=168172 RepID=A0ACC0EJN3_9BASI|nr:hypothetical protein MJO28_006673 [Puccinia striiformis f. sp. tritici]
MYRSRFITINQKSDQSKSVSAPVSVSPGTPVRTSVSSSAPRLPMIPTSPALDVLTQNKSTVSESHVPRSSAPPAKRFTYEWVPSDQRAPKDISSSINPSNIIEGSSRKNLASPDLSCVIECGFPELNFYRPVSINNAMNDDKHIHDWDDALSSEFHSLQAANTGVLTPPPLDDKIIGGVWLLTRKLNEFKEITCHETRWVVFGNHQEHMLHYFQMYSSVARNESLKMMLSIAINQDLYVFQFDVETAFLYGDIYVSIYVSQVLGIIDLDKIPSKHNTPSALSTLRNMHFPPSPACPVKEAPQSSRRHESNRSQDLKHSNITPPIVTRSNVSVKLSWNIMTFKRT